MATGQDIAKAGWLYRESSVLKRWKKNWVVLDRNGDLRYFESPDHHTAEERIVVRAQVLKIRTGFECGALSPPDRMGKSSLFVLDMNNGESIAFCAETPDDMSAWKIALEDARTQMMAPRATNISYQTVVNPLATTTVIGGPGYYHSGYSGYPGRVLSAPAVTVVPQTQVYQAGGPMGATTVINAPPPQQVVYMDSSPCYYRRRGLWGPYLW
ncbi:pleckstrin homology domain-containing family B member 2 [Patella vulgata]|uniref:pleckstrin homology domain-containing family B member 2 n=1 Tax=Patella vulgata TaxID=6465 RepID=UPI0021802797|nr:pleckstrin homology domain-containing family B member 2 [Patella vulgata]XP_050414947.1 pleckstrin homology domain-containing family B member 2 [Patella vulgata]